MARSRTSVRGDAGIVDAIVLGPDDGLLVLDRWREAWTLTLVITVLTALASKASVWIAEASGGLVNAIAMLHSADNARRCRRCFPASGC